MHRLRSGAVTLPLPRLCIWRYDKHVGSPQAAPLSHRSCQQSNAVLQKAAAYRAHSLNTAEVASLKHTNAAGAPTANTLRHASEVPARIADCAEQVRVLLGQHRSVLLACDPSPEGVLSAVGIAYLAHARDDELRLASARATQPQIGEAVVRTPADDDADTVAFAQRVMHGFAAKVTVGCRKRAAGGCSPTCDNACVRRLVYATASDDDAMPDVVYRYLRLGFAMGPRVRQLIAHPQVVAFNDLARFVIGECEHTRQFVRFSHMADGSFAAFFSAKANTIPLTASHFAARMRTERFFMVDQQHLIAAFHQSGQARCHIVRIDAAIAHDLIAHADYADDERYVRAMWQRFYQGTTTPGRDRSQRGYDLRAHWMPQRFWSGLFELEPFGQQEELQVPTRYNGHDEPNRDLPPTPKRASLK